MNRNAIETGLLLLTATGATLVANNFRDTGSNTLNDPAYPAFNPSSSLQVKVEVTRLTPEEAILSALDKPTPLGISFREYLIRQRVTWGIEPGFDGIIDQTNSQEAYFLPYRSSDTLAPHTYALTPSENNSVPFSASFVLVYPDGTIHRWATRMEHIQAGPDRILQVPVFHDESVKFGDQSTTHIFIRKPNFVQTPTTDRG